MTWAASLLRIRNRGDLAWFVFAICVFSTVGSMGLVYVLAPARSMSDSMVLAAIIPTVTGVPAGYWAGQRIWEIHRLNARLQHMLDYDPLTEVHTRRYFFEAIEARRPDRPSAVAIVDIDHFKRVNDTYGHHAGDLILRDVAQRLRDGCRNGDFVARIGGEEFALFFDSGALEDVRAIAERMRRMIESHRTLSQGQRMNCTISIGVGLLPPDEPADDALRRIDDALYEAKRTGRNRVMLANQYPGQDRAGVNLMSAS